MKYHLFLRIPDVLNCFFFIFLMFLSHLLCNIYICMYEYVGVVGSMFYAQLGL